MELKRLLEEIAKEQGILNAEIEDPLKSEKGEGYLTSIAAVNIKGKHQIGKNVELQLIIKTPPTNEKLKESLMALSTFHRELIMYEKVFPAFRDFERARGVLDPFPVVPKCYKTCSKNGCEAIILENMKAQGYAIWEQNLVLEDNHVKMILSQYARFHSVAAALRDQNPKLFGEFSKTLDENFEPFLTKSKFFSTFVNMPRRAASSLDPVKDKEVLRVYQKFLNGIEETFREMLRCTQDPFVILHGDCWTNNMLIKHENNDTTRPESMRLIDFQFAKASPSPVFDLSWFIYVCTSKDVINNLNYYLRYYHEHFSSHLKKLGSDPEKVFPYSELENHWRKYAKYGLIVSAFFRHILLTEKSETVDLTDIVLSGKNIETAFYYELKHTDKYKARMRNIITHFVENKFI